MNTYKEALDWIQSQLKFGIKPGLERMNYMLSRLGNPEKNIHAIHIAGTNGKGSTLSYMREMLTESGKTVGTFTSPYIEQFNERISVNGEPISDEEMIQLVQFVQPVVEETATTEHGTVTEFEIITLMSMYYFGKIRPVDYVLYECGMGGRLDSTNVISPILTLITTIGFDHMDVLGETVEKITFEKAGIMKKGIPLITGVKQPEAIQVIEKRGLEEHSELFIKEKDFFATHTQSDQTGETFSFTSPLGDLEKVKISMKGTHQVDNASLALMGILFLKETDGLSITETQIRSGLEKTKWIGRFETMQARPLVIVDGAHNPEGVQALAKTIQAHYSDKHITIMFSALGDKKLPEMIAELETFADRMIFTTFDYPRAIPAAQMAKLCKQESEAYESHEEALKQAMAGMIDENVLVITGSLYFISLMRQYFVD